MCRSLDFPNFLNETYGIFLSKVHGSDIIDQDKFRAIQVGNHLFKVLEKYLLKLMNREGCGLFVTGDYQAGFKPAGSTKDQVIKLLISMRLQK